MPHVKIYIHCTQWSHLKAIGRYLTSMKHHFKAQFIPCYNAQAHYITLPSPNRRYLVNSGMLEHSGQKNTTSYQCSTKVNPATSPRTIRTRTITAHRLVTRLRRRSSSCRSRCRRANVPPCCRRGFHAIALTLRPVLRTALNFRLLGLMRGRGVIRRSVGVGVGARVGSNRVAVVTGRTRAGA